jgi:outer membrane biosynthesis protein TonB
VVNVLPRRGLRNLRNVGTCLGVTVFESKSRDKLLLWAIAISLIIHLAAYSGWKWSQTHPWWKKFELPAWMQLGRSKAVEAMVKKLSAVTPPEAQPLLYIAVDPDLASPEPPKNPKFYSSADTKAANTKINIPSDVPQIDGKQTEYAKTVPRAEKMVPLQPSPPKTENQPEKTEVADTKPEVAEAKPSPKQTATRGDLTVAKPAEKTSNTKGTSESESGTAAQAQPKRDRPRTLADARAEKGLPGETSRQAGGVARLSGDPTMDAARTPFGDYDRDFVEAVQSRWDSLLEGRMENAVGKVVLEFDLHSDGRITGMTNALNEVNLLLETFCESAILDPAPFKPWPNAMRSLITDPRHLRFTFYYNE